jgi:hypothetical protein
MPPKRPMESARHPAREIVHLTPSDDQERRHYEIPRRATFERAGHGMGWRLVTRSLVSMLQMAMLAYAVGEASQCALHPIPLVFICSSAARDGTRRLLIQQRAATEFPSFRRDTMMA